MVEIEQAHRIQHDNMSFSAVIGDTKRGHWMGWTISLAGIGGCIYTAFIGAHPTVSIALVSIPIVTLVNAIIKSKSNSK